MGITPLNGVTIKKDGETKVTSPTIINFTSGTDFDVENSPDGTAKITIPNSVSPAVKFEGTTISASYTVIEFVEGSTLNVTVATSDGVTTVTITIPSGASATFSRVYFGSGIPSTLHNNGDFYFDTSITPYLAYVQNSNAWVNF